ncbi:TIGR03986 family CRISPR-associated RAMP protein [Thermobifida halotolerans]|uniref:TIGR03986 family CRISPR-associated RAMP protein n=2 Tax=Thermobifida halotolerans TaxID=483545 RepID=A0AA97M5T5_9ACTN|nr:TIGR03986 family CRISPR-associated RAMP protein [Thermobifida halotolerans]
MRARMLHASALAEGVDTDTLLRGHGRALPGTRTGWIDVSIRTLSPLFVGQAPVDGAVNRSLRVDGRPAVPGSTLRGLLRHTLRMLTGGETGPVNTPRLFFRAPVRLDPDSRRGAVPVRTRAVVGAQHERYRRLRGGRTRQGFLLHRDGEWFVKEVPRGRRVPRNSGTALRISFGDLRASLERWPFGAEFPDPPTATAYGPHTFEPHRPWQYREVFAVVLSDPDRRRWRPPAAARIAPTREEAREYLRECGTPGEVVRCVVVLTGVAGARRANAHLFPVPEELARGAARGPGGDFPVRDCHPVPRELVRLVDSADQVTRYQVENFPDEVSMVEGGAGRPGPGRLPLHSPEPVWFTVAAEADGDGRRWVTSFGRAGGYRVAVGGADPVRRAVPEELWSPQHGDADRGRRGNRPVDVPRALFGDLDVLRGEVSASRGRVRVGYALGDGAGADHPGGPRRVRLLSPQRGCFANYLLQPDPGRYGERPDLVSWAHEGDVGLGGYKVFLHRYRDGAGVELDEAAGAADDTCRDIVPLREGLVLTGRITFTNLTDGEVGALLRALLLGNPADGGDARDPEHAHKIGLGKSLGLGSVHLTPRLYLVDRRARATSPDVDAGVVRADAERVAAFLEAFDAALARARLGRADPARWTEVEQARDVLLASRWRRRLPWEWTRPMTLEEFATYPVLPGLVERFERFDARAAAAGG